MTKHKYIHAQIYLALYRIDGLSEIPIVFFALPSRRFLAHSMSMLVAIWLTVDVESVCKKIVR